ncbi:MULTISPECIES: glycosyltransferase [unclassified Frankia]|uniref:glycosyltransferase n=1 Tax=unclassified Frankia TaxID=2632575 RepID=UPI002AD55979|nr:MULTISPECIES: glycosyltransferase [unclassified Frankia]
MRLDIIIPAHNEEHRIGRTLDSYLRALDAPGIRFLVALDYCTDETAAIVRSRQLADGRLHMYRYPKLGKGGVIIETLRRTDAELVAFVDADRATPPGELLRLAAVAQDVGAAVASRWHPASLLPVARPLGRRTASFGFATLVRMMFRLPYFDTQCGAKVFRRDVLDQVAPHLSARDFLFDVDLLVVARALGCEVAEVPTVWIDQKGSRLNLFADSRRMIRSLLRLWLRHRMMPVPAPVPAAPGVAPAPLMTGQRVVDVAA